MTPRELPTHTSLTDRLSPTGIQLQKLPARLSAILIILWTLVDCSVVITHFNLRDMMVRHFMRWRDLAIVVGVRGTYYCVLLSHGNSN